jgi:hypothetical protein
MPPDKWMVTCASIKRRNAGMMAVPHGVSGDYKQSDNRADLELARRATTCSRVWRAVPAQTRTH